MKTPRWKRIETSDDDDLRPLPSESRDVIVVSTSFNPHEKSSPAASFRLADNSARLLNECARLLKFGGLLLIYGIPRNLAAWGEHLALTANDAWTMLFKYWIALEIDAAPRTGFLKPSHLGLLLFLKSKANSRSPSPFHLNTSTVKVPHAFCSACGKNVKDWGGKKHLMNPKGTALADVWRDLPRVCIRNSIAPSFVLKRILALTSQEQGSYLHVVEKAQGIKLTGLDMQNGSVASNGKVSETVVIRSLERDTVYLGDCVSFLKRVEELHPEGFFDLAFADPPYNLAKKYDNYQDALADQHYIEWCNQWLDGMARTLKPGGSLFVLNLPKWAIHHAAFLNRHLEFRHWIVWDALSDPRGKIMPAHYALLYYTKPGGQPVFNYAPLGNGANTDAVLPPDAPRYCLRASCVKQRKAAGDDEKVELSDIWFDIHRIKHKRDRDAHPCQLPDKLMERIIRLTTNPGGLVFDPFCGAGTTAIMAAKLKRHFVVTDIDPNYIRITREKLISMRDNVDLFGDFMVPRLSIAKRKAPASKREVEMYLQHLASKLGHPPTEQNIEVDNPSILQKIDMLYPNRGAALKRAKIVLPG